MANITLILIATFLALSNGFDDKFCKVERKPCTTITIKKVQTLHCQKFQCNGKYKYKCTESICSTSKKHCTDFMENFLLMNALNAFSFERVTGKMKNCAKIAYQLKKTDICQNENNCFVRQNSMIRDDFSVTPIRCTCPDKHSFRCNLNYCTVNSEACDTLNYGKKASNFTISSCNNSKNITRKNNQYLGFSRF